MCTKALPALIKIDASKRQEFLHEQKSLKYVIIGPIRSHVTAMRLMRILKIGPTCHNMLPAKSVSPTL